MGVNISRLRRSVTSMRLRRSIEPPPRSFSTNQTISPLDSDLRTYQATYDTDDSLRSFDSALQNRTRRAINSIHDGFDAGAVSLDSLKQVTESFLLTNHDVVELIQANKKDIWKNKELSELVDEYLCSSLMTLDFCAKLDSCLKRATHIETIVNVVNLYFKEENSVVVENGCVRSYTKTLEKLENLRKVEDPFTEEFFKILHSVCTHQNEMLKRLRAKKMKIDKKLSNLKTYKRICNAIFIAVFATILVCSVVAAAFSAPPVVTALVAAATVPMGSMGKWLSSIWRKHEKVLTVQMETVGSMQLGNFLVIKDLQNIRVQIERFETGIEALKRNAEFAVQGAEEEVMAAVEEIMKEVASFSKVIRELAIHSSKCCHDTSVARSLILTRMLSHN